MKRIFSLFALPTLLFASHAFAYDPYTTLKGLYETASAPATFNDVASIGQLTCVAAVNIEQTMASPISFSFQRNVLIPGIPAQGPELPGTPDRTVASCLSWAPFPDQLPSQDFCADETVTSNATDLVFAAPFYLWQRSQTPPRATFVAFRLNKKLLTMKVDESFSTADPVTGQTGIGHQLSYGYCY